PAARQVTADGGGQRVDAVAHDRAGNAASASVTGINIDSTAPSIAGSLVASPNAAGWLNGAARVHFSCADPLSGIASCDADAVLRAGNAEPLNQVVVHYDNLAPTLTHVVTPPPNAAGWSTADTTVHFVASDGAGSGLAAVTPDVTVSAETPGVVARGSAADAA